MLNWSLGFLGSQSLYHYIFLEKTAFCIMACLRMFMGLTVYHYPFIRLQGWRSPIFYKAYKGMQKSLNVEGERR